MDSNIPAIVKSLNNFYLIFFCRPFSIRISHLNHLVSFFSLFFQLSLENDMWKKNFLIKCSMNCVHNNVRNRMLPIQILSIRINSPAKIFRMTMKGRYAYTTYHLNIWKCASFIKKFLFLSFNWAENSKLQFQIVWWKFVCYQLLEYSY